MAHYGIEAHMGSKPTSMTPFSMRIGQGEYGIYHCEEDTFVIEFQTSLTLETLFCGGQWNV
jgi:hypothetical protein